MPSIRPGIKPPRVSGCSWRGWRKSFPKEIQDCFQVVTYKEYNTTRELYTQLKSEKNLFYLISIILLTATSVNIFSMLFILVHTKTKEIAIMRALGASKRTIQAIFVLGGALLGIIGTLLGTVFAQGTLTLLPEIMNIIGAFQGQEMLQSTIYGGMERTTLDFSTLLFCFAMTICTSAFAGWLASLKTLKVHISESLRTG